MAAITDNIPGSEQDQHDRITLVAPASERAANQRVARALRPAPERPVKLVTGDGQEIALPDTLLRILRRSADLLAGDRAVLLDSLGQQITPDQAAEALGFPLDYVMTLLESGELPSDRKQNARLLSLKDVLAYREAFKQKQREALRDLSQTSQKLGLFDLVYEERDSETDDEAAEP